MRRWLAVLPLVYVLFFFGLTASGVLGPDEPRYASIGREMARSGDWVTPRLWGSPWYEKPALLYWMTGAAFKAGIGDDLAPRLPVALASVAFLAFFFWILRREFGGRAAAFSTVILGTSAGWLAYSYVGVTDLPMTAAFAASILVALPWLATGDRRFLPLTGALLGVAVLAKGLVPLVLAWPLAWAGRRRIFDLLRPQTVLPFFAVAAPWYLLCWLRNGEPFIRVFFLQHHFQRFASEALKHTQPVWFYIPVLLAALLPWTPLAALLFRRAAYADPRRFVLLLWLGFGLVFFSAAANKLPGYLLPLLPAVAALAGTALAEAKRATALLTACALLLVAVPVTVSVLPQALAAGLTHSHPPAFSWLWLAPLVIAAAVWRETSSARSVAVIAVALSAGILYLKVSGLPAIDRAVSARPLWRDVAARRGEVCVGDVHRNLRYGLNYYSVVPLPDCSISPLPVRIGR